MENFKIDLFEKEYKINFPDFIHLSESDSLLLAERISAKFDIPINFLVEGLSIKQSFLENINAEDNFILFDVLHQLTIKPMLKVYINWYKFDNIDLFSTTDLSKYFYDIWFPSADDIDLFDESLDWIVTIRHDGAVSFLKNV